jgi:predicted dehydrogenase
MTIRLDLLSDLPYRPQSPRGYSPNIGLIGCGGITHYHLRAYTAAKFQVSAVCDLDVAKAESRRQEFYPAAKVYTDYKELLADDTIEVVDISTHPPERPPIIEAALRAGKHVLSQKPFVLDLDEGERLIEVAQKMNRRLAVNQNGRWAPHFSYARQVVNAGCIGDVFGAHLSCHWDHTWVQGSEFEKVKHLILYDYAIHWFDIVRCLLKGKKVKRVFASTARAPGQQLMPDLLAQALIEFDEAQATLAFDASLPHGSQERTFLSGTTGSLYSVGSGNQEQELTVNTSAGSWTPKLVGKWFPDGFHGTMGELLCAIEEGRETTINAEDNLRSLELCFAAIHSAETGQPVIPGAIRRLPS